MKIRPPVTCAPWNPVRVKNTPANIPSRGRKPTWVYSQAWPERNAAPRITVGMSQRMHERRSPRAIARTASCIVTLEDTRATVMTIGRPTQVGFSPKIGSHAGIRARR